MPWNGTGTYSRSNGVNSGDETWQDDRDAATKIRADRHDVHDQDIADAITACLAKNGENAATADLDLGANKFTNAADGAADDDLATFGQVQKWFAQNVTHDMASDANYALTTAQNLYGRITITDTTPNLTTTRTITVANERVFLFQNSTAQSLFITGSGGTGVTLAADARSILFCDASGNVYTANYSAGSGIFVGARGYMAASTGTSTPVQFIYTEDYDTNAIYNPVNGRFTIPAGYTRAQLIAHIDTVSLGTPVTTLGSHRIYGSIAVDGVTTYDAYCDTGGRNERILLDTGVVEVTSGTYFTVSVATLGDTRTFTATHCWASIQLWE